ncbi:hypothetical protein HPB49_008335 [Dermacentor silvarum]|uniref:Uncharacterized protein n=1 Tax=Dermacentor silvarum TaxID=543639 RepID=A0ACB8C8G1_DERSI|nr:hypothetical protein HPB49_008335 [Dermacentor silvarum]
MVTAEATLKYMWGKNRKLTDDTLKSKIKDLPLKQQLQVMACFNACKRSSTKGMKYQAEWILECLLMRMKSKRLYEHLRKERIMLLPGRTCLQRYLRSFRSGFGFNRRVFSALKEKCCEMPEHQRHGGILLDKMKLSENLSVDQYGQVNGLVDLGQFSTGSASSVMADHALVVIFQPFTGK